MGLFRLFVMPAGAPPSEGTYLTYPARDLLAVLALESRRARCVVIGEDLGTVAAGVREALADHGILGVPAGVVRGRAGGVRARGSRWRPSRRTTCRPWRAPTAAIPATSTWTRLAPVVAGRDPAIALHEHVASSPALLACAALDDVVGATVQPNVPGTVDEFPNWRVPLPEPLEAIPGDPRAQAVLARHPRPGREEPAGARRTGT